MTKIDRLEAFSPAEVRRLRALEIETLDDLWLCVGADTYSGVQNLAELLKVQDPEAFALRLEKIALKEIEMGRAIAIAHIRPLFWLWKVYASLKRRAGSFSSCFWSRLP
jgi:hypothetical protein